MNVLVPADQDLRECKVNQLDSVALAIIDQVWQFDVSMNNITCMQSINNLQVNQKRKRGLLFSTFNNAIVKFFSSASELSVKLPCPSSNSSTKPCIELVSKLFSSFGLHLKFTPIILVSYQLFCKLHSPSSHS